MILSFHGNISQHVTSHGISSTTFWTFWTPDQPPSTYCSPHYILGPGGRLKVDGAIQEEQHPGSAIGHFVEIYWQWVLWIAMSCGGKVTLPNHAAWKSKASRQASYLIHLLREVLKPPSTLVRPCNPPYLPTIGHGPPAEKKPCLRVPSWRRTGDGVRLREVSEGRRETASS